MLNDNPDRVSAMGKMRDRLSLADFCLTEQLEIAPAADQQA